MDFKGNLKEQRVDRSEKEVNKKIPWTFSRKKHIWLIYDV